MIRKNLHMKIKRIFCGILTAAMLLGQTGAVWAEATDTASGSPTPTPDPHTEYYAQAADTDSIEGWPEGPKIEAQSAVLMDLNIMYMMETVIKLMRFLKISMSCYLIPSIIY